MNIDTCIETIVLELVVKLREKGSVISKKERLKC